jgi:hypothetical protein
MAIAIVRYRVKPEYAEENVAFVEAVYEELATDEPEGFRYATFRLADGVGFIHLAVEEGQPSPLPELAAFKRFQAGIGERCDQDPVVAAASAVGSYGFDPAPSSGPQR